MRTPDAEGQPRRASLFIVGVVMICPTCERDPCPNSTFCAACREADAEKAKKPKDPNILRLRRLLDSSSLEAVWTELNTSHDRAATSTVEALMLGVRQHGIAALQEPRVRNRLAQLSEAQLVEVGDRLQLLKFEIARAWTPDEVGALVDAWERLHAV